MPTISNNSMRIPQMPCPVAPRRKSYAYRRTPDGVNNRTTTRAGQGCLIATATSESMSDRMKAAKMASTVRYKQVLSNESDPSTASN